MFTITVQGRILANPTSAPSPQQDISQWHLPAADMRNEGKYMFKLHTIDLYFWTPEDAELFLDSLKRVLAPGQLRILDANTTHPEHRDSMSPVVQQLEKAAITQPQQAQRSNSISTTHTTNSTAAVGAGVVPANGHTPVSPPVSPPATDAQQVPPVFAPMAYNPAAPAAPEPIAHREKTPPPLDAEGGTGLNIAATHESGAMHMPPQQQQYMMNPLQQQFTPQPTAGPYAPGPGVQRANTIAQTSIPGVQPGPPMAAPLQSPSYGATFAGPPQPNLQHGVDPNAHLYAQQQQPSAGLMRQNTMPVGGYAPQSQYAQYPAAAGYAGAPLSSGTPVSPGLYQQLPPPPQQQSQQQQQQQQQPQPQQAAYAPGNLPAYVPQQQQSAYGVNHGIHNQLYIPEGATTPAQAGPGQEAATGKFEQRMKATEKGVNTGFSKLLKRLDKKI
jgi:hypothetical protein